MDTSELRDHMNGKLADQIAEKQKPVDKEKPLTREQRRFKDRVESEATLQLNTFISRFYEFFMDNDPESEEVTKKRKELSAKWKMYCGRKNFKAEAFPLFDTAAQKIVDQFNEAMKEA